MSTNTDVLPPLNRKTATVRGRAISQSKSGPVPKTGWLSRPGSLTQTFFARGEEQEATEYENLPIDDPTLAPPPVEFDSFDKIPRRRGSWFAIAVSMLVVAAIGFVTWRSFHYLSKPATSVAAASRAMVQSPSAPAPAPVSQPVTQSIPAATPPEPINQSTRPAPAEQSAKMTQEAPAAPAAQSAKMTQEAPAAPVAQSAPMTDSTSATPAAPAHRPAPAGPSTHAATPAPIVVPLVTKDAPSTKHTPVTHEPSTSDSEDEPVRMHKHPPLHGYVWSPEKHTLVPAEPVIDDLPSEAPRSQPLESAPAQESQPAPEPTTPAPFPSPPLPPSSTSPSSTNQAPIIE